jgi:hypothetical protein
MEDLLTTMADWRFAACVAFLGGIIGPWIYRKIPVPAEAAKNLERLGRAHAASGMAREAGISEVENVARMAGMVAGYGVMSALRRQSRQSIVVGVVLAAVISAFLFASLQIASIPPWIFAAAGLFGVFRLWKAW